MKDRNGREYARLSELKPGDKVEVDASFICMRPGAILTVYEDDTGQLYIPCDYEGHYLNGQSDSLIGIYHAKETSS